MILFVHPTLCIIMLQHKIKFKGEGLYPVLLTVTQAHARMPANTIHVTAITGLAPAESTGTLAAVPVVDPVVEVVVVLPVVPVVTDPVVANEELQLGAAMPYTERSKFRRKFGS
jgi:hypothetical protein